MRRLKKALANRIGVGDGRHLLSTRRRQIAALLATGALMIPGILLTSASGASATPGGSGNDGGGRDGSTTTTSVPVPGGNFSCTASAVYDLAPGGNIYDVNPGASSPKAQLVGLFGSSGPLNGLGISLDGTAAWAALSPTSSNGTVTVLEYNPSNGDTTTYTAPGSDKNLTILMGAVSPAGFYYYAGYEGPNLDVWEFIPPTSGTVGTTTLVASLYAASGSDAGDLVFDQSGNLYVLEGSNGTDHLYYFPAGSSGSFGSPSSVATFDSNGYTYDGLVVDDDGNLYVQYADANTAHFLEVVPTVTMSGTTWTVGSPISITAAGGYPSPSTFPVLDDLGSCDFGTPGSISLTKSASPGVVTEDGTDITYTFTVTNNGGYPLTDVTVTDTQTSPAQSPQSVSCPDVPAKSSETCTLVVSVDVADPGLAASEIDDSAVATGTEIGTTLTSNQANASVQVDIPASLSIVKSVQSISSGTDDVTAADQTITYAFLVTNTGSQALTGIAVDDTQTAPAGSLTSAPSCPDASLAPGASETCTATYSVTQADLNNGSIADSAYATGVDVAGSTVQSSPSGLTVPVDQSPAITVAKSASPTEVSNVGQTVTYSFLVTNTGNVTLSDIAVNDTQTAPAGSLTSAPSCPDASLAAGASETCTATYSVTQADLSNGSIADTATAQGTAPGAGTPTVSAPSSATVTVAGTSAANGTTTTTTTIPHGTSAGSGGSGGSDTVIPATAASSSSLPFTGTDAERTAWLAIVLILGGGLVVMATRRRRRPSES